VAEIKHQIRQIEYQLDDIPVGSEPRELLERLRQLDPYSRYLCKLHRPSGRNVGLSYSQDVNGNYSTFAPICSGCRQGFVDRLKWDTHTKMWEIVNKALQARTISAINKAYAELRNMEIHTGTPRTGSMDFELAHLKAKLEDEADHI
jgi:hypothetical protein